MAALYGAGALSSLLARWSGRLALGVGHLAALAGAVVGLGVSLGVLLGDPGRTLIQPLPDLFPFARLSLSVDGLSAYFLLVISLVAVAAAIYGPAYLQAHAPDMRPALGGAGARTECVPWLHGVGLLRRRRADLPPLLGRHDARQLRPRRLRRPGWRERAGRAPLHGDDPRRNGPAARRIPCPDRAGRGIRLCGPSRRGG